MRRSKAPSMLNKAKRLCSSGDHNKDAGHSLEPDDEQYNWGTGNRNSCKIQESNYENKRIFNVVWRDVSTKKHKTWKGDGTLEVNNFTVKAILKDETGKYMGCSSKFNKSDIAPDFQMVIGSKEIEIQNEITEDDELIELRKRQVCNRNWKDEECISSEDLAQESKKPKGGFKFKPILTLTSPEVPSSVKLKENNKWNTYEDTNLNLKLDYERNEELKTYFSICNNKPTLSVKRNGSYKEFLCFIRPSELQQFLFKAAIEYYSSVKSSLTLENVKSLDVVNVLQHICNHPSFINHNSTTNALMRHLQPNLPAWSEMGPFDSGKLEFVQYFLSDLNKPKSQNCIIIAKSANVLNMLEGLCDFMKIKCIRLQTNHLKDINEFCFTESNLSHVLLANSLQEINRSFDVSTCCKKILIFEDVSRNMDILSTLNNVKDIVVYYLVTAFSVEELLLVEKYQECKENLLELLDELVNISNINSDCCYLHSKIECNCFERSDESVIKRNIFTKDWQHFKQPFNMQLLKITLLENSAEHIVSIFYKYLN